MKKFIAFLTLACFFLSQPLIASAQDSTTTVNCVRGQPCEVTLDLRARASLLEASPLPPVVPTAANNPPDYTWAWVSGGVLTAAAIVVAAVLITDAIRDTRDRGQVIDINLKNPPAMEGGGS